MKQDLILIANATRARLCHHEDGAAQLAVLSEAQDPEGRMKAGELAGDHLGHVAADQRPGGTSFAPRLDPRRKQHLAFARLLAAQVEQHLQQGHYREFLLFASSPFLGEMKEQLGPRAKRALRAAVDLDLTSCPLDELEPRVDQAVAARTQGGLRP